MDIQLMRTFWHFIGFIMLITKFSNGQSVTLTGPSVVEQGSDTVYTCTGGADPYFFSWTDLSVNPNVLIFIGGEVSYQPDDTKYVNFGVSENEGTSTMTINNTLIGDEGLYRCSEGQERDGAELTVEVESERSLEVESTIESNIDMYVATCEALGGRPDETITWMLSDGRLPCDDVVVTYPADGEGLFSTTSVCTFQATNENNGQTLKCVISGHQVLDLNGEVTTNLDTHRSPTTDIRVGFQFLEPSLTVSCDIADPTQPIPSIMNYYIYSDGTLIHQSSTGDNDVEVPDTEFDLCTEFDCVAGNYLENITSDLARYDPTSTTTPSPSAESITTEGTTSSSSEPITTEGTTSSSSDPTPCTCEPTGLSSGASAGIALLAILLVASVIINIIQFIMLRRHDTRPGFEKSEKTVAGEGRNVSNEENDNMAYEMIQSGDRAYTSLKLGPSHSPIIAPENVTFFTRLGSIGRGDFGRVWKGELRSNQSRVDVAIRQIPDQVTKSKDVLRAVKLLSELPDQPNVVKCLGYCQEQGSILYEFISGGTLLTHLQTTGMQSQPTYGNLKPNGVRINEGSLLNLAWQIAKGMQYLASKKIIHGTLCAHNVLLADRKQCKLSDYGLSSSLFSGRGKPTRWSSPETMVTGDPSTEGDSWSFGIVLWEIVTLGARPYPKMTFDTVQKEVANGYQMPRPRHCGQEVYTIMSGCWEKEATNRSNFDQILKSLERILEKTHNYLSLNDLDEGLYASTLDM